MLSMEFHPIQFNLIPYSCQCNLIQLSPINTYSFILLICRRSSSKTLTLTLELNSLVQLNSQIQPKHNGFKLISLFNKIINYKPILIRLNLPNWHVETPNFDLVWKTIDKFQKFFNQLLKTKNGFPSTPFTGY